MVVRFGMLLSGAERVRYADYLARERASDAKHEYVDGVVLARAGGTPEHGRLALSLAALISRALVNRPCAAFSSDVRVRVPATGRSTYPDLSVVCGSLERADDDPDAIVNPALIVEVLSASTEAADRGEKFAHYRRLPSLREYVLVSQDVPRIEVFRRERRGDATRWVYTEFGAGEHVDLDSVDAVVAVDDVYFDPLAAAPPRTSR